MNTNMLMIEPLEALNITPFLLDSPDGEESLLPIDWEDAFSATSHSTNSSFVSDISLFEGTDISQEETAFLMSFINTDMILEETDRKLLIPPVTYTQDFETAKQTSFKPSYRLNVNIEPKSPMLNAPPCSPENAFLKQLHAFGNSDSNGQLNKRPLPAIHNHSMARQRYQNMPWSAHQQSRREKRQRVSKMPQRYDMEEFRESLKCPMCQRVYGKFDALRQHLVDAEEKYGGVCFNMKAKTIVYPKNLDY